MADTHDIDVFFSYDHNDRERVRPLVEEVRRNGWAVWWHTSMSIGNVSREVLTDRFDHARAVCVIWTVRSVDGEFARDEASRANARGSSYLSSLPCRSASPASAISSAPTYAAGRR
jgi:hypothetical protein